MRPQIHFLAAFLVSGGIAVTLLAGGCGGHDPRALTSEGYAALGKGDTAGALSKFDEALEGLDPKHDQYLRATLGRCEALAKTDPARAKSSFFQATMAQPEKVREDDYSLICSALLQACATIDAIDVMKAGHDRFPESPKMIAMVEAVKSAAKREKTSEAVEKLKSMGYL
jgi:hypothetical protein